MRGDVLCFFVFLFVRLILIIRPELLAMARTLKGNEESISEGPPPEDAPDEPVPDDPPAEKKIELNLWFLREGSVLRCYVEESWKDAPLPRLTGGRSVVPGSRPEVLGCITFCEVIDERDCICGFYGAIYDGGGVDSIERTLHECVNCRIIDDGTYLIALGETQEDIDAVERRFRLGGDAVTCSCGFEESILLDDESWAMRAYGWYEWRDREQRILAFENNPHCSFSRPTPILDR